MWCLWVLVLVGLLGLLGGLLFVVVCEYYFWFLGLLLAVYCLQFGFGLRFGLFAVWLLFSRLDSGFVGCTLVG